jgi:predicted benzoate:H+ symporter BenE
MAVVVALFVSANIALYAIVPIEDTETSNTIALVSSIRVALAAGISKHLF